MEKVTPQLATKFYKEIDGNTYYNNPFYLAFDCFYEEKNGETLVYEKDPIDLGVYNLIHLPKNKSNWTNQRFVFLTENDLNKLKSEGLDITMQKQVEKEFICKTENFVNMEGSEFKRFRKTVARFQRNYNVEVKHQYDIEKAKGFLHKWKEEYLERKNFEEFDSLSKEIFEVDFAECINSLDILDIIPNKAIFLEVDGKLAAFRIASTLNDGTIVGVMQKTDFQYEGIAKFLYHQTAKEYGENKHEFFNIGPSLTTELSEFKESLHPYLVRPLYFVMTTGKK